MDLVELFTYYDSRLIFQEHRFISALNYFRTTYPSKFVSGSLSAYLDE